MFPCTDLSIAGARNGLDAAKSGASWPFWEVGRRLADIGRAPRMVVLENVEGLLTSTAVKDFASVCGAIAAGGYHLGTVVMDAALFLPQSRVRVFVVAMRAEATIPARLISDGPCPQWSRKRLIEAVGHFPAATAARWTWWNMPVPPVSTARLADLADRDASDVRWHRPDETVELVAKMTHHDLARARRG